MYRVQTFQKDFLFYTEAVFFLLIVPQRVCQSVRGTETFLEFIGGTILLSDCQFKGYPVGSKAKADKGITPT